MALATNFFQADTVTVAKRLLGKLLIRQTPDGDISGRIVETEAYLGQLDPASHAFGGLTRRNRAMFGPPGRAYIYFTYGMHHCFNVVTGPIGVGEAVLIRALEPMAGLDLMRQRRAVINHYQLANGPAKLVQALGITPALYGHDLSQPPLWLANDGYATDPGAIKTSPRIGLRHAAEKPLRFYLLGNPFVSGTSRAIIRSHDRTQAPG